MTAVVLTSELEAINTMLEIAGEAPVQSLALTGLLPLDRAKAKLDEISRIVQSMGWQFNTNEDVALTRNVGNEIPVASSWLSVEPNPEYSHYKAAPRGTRLWNGRDNLWTFDKDLKGSVVDLLAWDYLPEPARQYIMIRAARAFQRSGFGSDSVDRFTQDDENLALVTLSEYESRNGNYNMLTDSWDGARIVHAYEYGEAI
jgi:Tail tubular protein